MSRQVVGMTSLSNGGPIDAVEGRGLVGLVHDADGRQHEAGAERGAEDESA